MAIISTDVAARMHVKQKRAQAWARAPARAPAQRLAIRNGSDVYYVVNREW